MSRDPDEPTAGPEQPADNVVPFPKRPAESAAQDRESTEESQRRGTPPPVAITLEGFANAVRTALDSQRLDPALREALLQPLGGAPSDGQGPGLGADDGAAASGSEGREAPDAVRALRDTFARLVANGEERGADVARAARDAITKLVNGVSGAADAVTVDAGFLRTHGRTLMTQLLQGVVGALAPRGEAAGAADNPSAQDGAAAASGETSAATEAGGAESAVRPLHVKIDVGSLFASLLKRVATAGASSDGEKAARDGAAAAADGGATTTTGAPGASSDAPAGAVGTDVTPNNTPGASSDAPAGAADTDVAPGGTHGPSAGSDAPS